MEQDPASSADSDSEASLQSSDLDDLIDDVVESVDKLSKVAFAINKSSAQSHKVKGAAYEDWEDGTNKNELFERLVSVVLEHRYPNISFNLKHRLTTTISQRRRQLVYLRKNRPKAIQGGFIDTEARSNPSFMASSPSQETLGDRELLTAKTEVLRINPSTPNLMRSQTTASILPPVLFRDNKFSVALGLSYSQLSQLTEEDLPPPPSINHGEKYFQCPYCYLLLSHEKAGTEAWR